MKSISNSDFSLLVEKLPIVQRYARGAIPAADLKAFNAARMLGQLHNKLLRQETKTKTNKPHSHDKE